MKFYADCAACLCDVALRRSACVQDEALRGEYMRRVCRIIAEADAENEAPPLVDARIIRLRREFLGVRDDFSEIKRSFNALVMGAYDELKARVEAADDPLRAAIQLSMAGNYIDFGVLRDVDSAELLRLLDEAAERRVDEAEYARLCADLAAPGELIFLHDNCGEVVLDKLLIETIRARYPGKHVASVVRGAPVQNDATIDDAREIGLSAVAEVLENGLEDIAGTPLALLNPALRARIERAGMVIAKGQGNFETLCGCGLNVYYLFLSKCPGYTRWYGFERFSGILQNDLRAVPAGGAR